MAIETFNLNDSGATIRTNLNANFADLDTTKADLASPTFTGTPVLPTGTTAVTQNPSDNSTKIATTAYVDNQVGTAISASSLIPKPDFSFTGAGVAIGPLVNTTASVGQIIVPARITVNKLSIVETGHSVNGTVKVVIYSADGQTQHISITTATITGAGIIETAVSAVTLNPGVYFVLIVPVGTFAGDFYFWDTDTTVPFGTTYNIGVITGKSQVQGTLTVTAGTPPATITPSSITYTQDRTLIVRLDN